MSSYQVTLQFKYQSYTPLRRYINNFLNFITAFFFVNYMQQFIASFKIKFSVPRYQWIFIVTYAIKDYIAKLILHIMAVRPCLAPFHQVQNMILTCSFSQSGFTIPSVILDRLRLRAIISHLCVPGQSSAAILKGAGGNTPVHLAPPLPALAHHDQWNLLHRWWSMLSLHWSLEETTVHLEPVCGHLHMRKPSMNVNLHLKCLQV